jgi:hypothetical protein
LTEKGKIELRRICLGDPNVSNIIFEFWQIDPPSQNKINSTFTDILTMGSQPFYVICAIKAKNGKFISCKKNGEIVADSSKVKNEQKWKMQLVTNKYYIRSTQILPNYLSLQFGTIHEDKISISRGPPLEPQNVWFIDILSSFDNFNPEQIQSKKSNTGSHSTFTDRVVIKSYRGHYLTVNETSRELEVVSKPSAAYSEWNRLVSIRPFTIGNLHAFACAADASGLWLCAYRGMTVASYTYSGRDFTRKWIILPYEPKWAHLQNKLFAELEMVVIDGQSASKAVVTLRDQLHVCQMQPDKLERLIMNES